MFLLSNHQGSACFLAGECAQQNWTLQSQEGMIRVLPRGKGTPHTMLLVLKKSPCRLETAVCTHTRGEQETGIVLFRSSSYPSHERSIHFFPPCLRLSIIHPYLHLPTHPWIRPLIFQCSFWVNSVWVNDAFHLCLSFLRPGAWSRLALTLGKQTREFQPDLLVTLELGTLNWVEGFDRSFCLEFWTNYD